MVVRLSASVMSTISTGDVFEHIRAARFKDHARLVQTHPQNVENVAQRGLLVALEAVGGQRPGPRKVMSQASLSVKSTP